MNYQGGSPPYYHGDSNEILSTTAWDNESVISKPYKKGVHKNITYINPVFLNGPSSATLFGTAAGANDFHVWVGTSNPRCLPHAAMYQWQPNDIIANMPADISNNRNKWIVYAWSYVYKDPDNTSIYYETQLSELAVVPVTDMAFTGATLPSTWGAKLYPPYGWLWSYSKGIHRSSWVKGGYDPRTVLPPTVPQFPPDLGEWTQYGAVWEIRCYRSATAEAFAGEYTPGDSSTILTDWSARFGGSYGC